jgi:Protein of unknown function (DUF3253)
MSRQLDDGAVTEAILSLVAARGAGKSICPSDAARLLAQEGEDWRQFLSLVRTVAARLAGDGRVAILRHGKPITPDLMRGVIRLALPMTLSEAQRPDAGSVLTSHEDPADDKAQDLPAVAQHDKPDDPAEPAIGAEAEQAAENIAD